MKSYQLGNGVIGVDDIVLFTPNENISVCEPTFEKALAIVEFVSDNKSEVCLKLFNNRKFQAIPVDCVKVLDYRDVNLLIDEALTFCSKNTYSADLQIVIDCVSEFEDLLNMCFDEFGKPHSSSFGAMAYDVDVIMEAMMVDRESGWSCNDLIILATIYNYAHKISLWYR